MIQPVITHTLMSVDGTAHGTLTTHTRVRESMESAREHVRAFDEMNGHKAYPKAVGLRHVKYVWERRSEATNARFVDVVWVTFE